MLDITQSPLKVPYRSQLGVLTKKSGGFLAFNEPYWFGVQPIDLINYSDDLGLSQLATTVEYQTGVCTPINPGGITLGGAGLKHFLVLFNNRLVSFVKAGDGKYYRLSMSTVQYDSDIKPQTLGAYAFSNQKLTQKYVKAKWASNSYAYFSLPFDQLVFGERSGALTQIRYVPGFNKYIVGYAQLGDPGCFVSDTLYGTYVCSKSGYTTETYVVSLVEKEYTNKSGTDLVGDYTDFKIYTYKYLSRSIKYKFNTVKSVGYTINADISFNGTKYAYSSGNTFYYYMWRPSIGPFKDLWVSTTQDGVLPTNGTTLMIGNTPETVGDLLYYYEDGVWKDLRAQIGFNLICDLKQTKQLNFSHTEDKQEWELV